MSKEVIIDGVDVSGCKYAEKSIPVDCSIDNCFCYENKNCYYKQMKRLEFENQELGKIIQCKTGTIVTLVEENKRLKKEIRLHDCIDKWGIRECHCACRCLGNEFCTDAEKKINEFKTKLEKIKEVINECSMNFKKCESCKFYKECDKSKNIEEYILKIIEGVEDD